MRPHRALALTAVGLALQLGAHARSFAHGGALLDQTAAGAVSTGRTLQQLQQQDCPQCTGCPAVKGYTGYRNARPEGGDVMHGDTPLQVGSVAIDQLGELCDHSCTCYGFSSTGAFKTSSSMTANALTDESCFYVRDTPPLACSQCAAVPGYKLYTSYDHYWDDLPSNLTQGTFNLTDIVKACNAECRCKGFNVLNWGSTEAFNEGSLKSLVWPMHPSIYNNAYFCLYEKENTTDVATCPADPCPPAPGYVALRGVDHVGDDIAVATNMYLPRPDGNGSPDMAAACNASCTCKGFSSTGDGYLKSSVTVNTKAVGQCLYQRVQDPPPCPVCPPVDGFDAMVGWDYVDKPLPIANNAALPSSLSAAGSLCLQDCRCRGMSFNTSAASATANVAAAVSLKGLAAPLRPVQDMCFYVRKGTVNFCTDVASIGVLGVSTPSPSSSSSGGSSSHTGAIVGGVVGGVVGAVLLVAGLVLGVQLWRRRNVRKGEGTARLLLPAGFSGGPNSPAEKLHRSLQLPPGDAFLMDVAPYFTWIERTPPGAQPVEAGLSWPVAESADVIALSALQVMQEVELCMDGCLGKGATALVFKCRMPKRCGPNALFAAKVMRMSQGADMQYMVQSFRYEAELLKRCRHHSVVRLFAYCLEPPCACLIMELCSTSLKDRLYGTENGLASHMVSTAVKGLGGTRTMGTTDTLLSVRESAYETASTAVPRTKNATSTSTPTNGTSTNTSSTTASPFAISATASPAAVSPQLHTAGGSGTLPTLASGGPLSPGSMASPTGPRMLISPRRSSLTAFSVVSAFGAPLSMLEVLQLSTDIAAGLAHLHAKRSPDEDAADSSGKEEHVVHRDLKPANILLNSQGQAKLSDFGLARGHQNTTVHTDHKGAGTLRYMAPEIIASGPDGKLTNKVDIYSLAVLMWELTAHQRPWPGCTDVNIPLLVMSGQRPATPGYPPKDKDDTATTAAAAAAGSDKSLEEAASFSAVPAFTALLHECWEQDPACRPDAATVHKRLQHILRELHVEFEEEDPCTP